MVLALVLVLVPVIFVFAVLMQIPVGPSARAERDLADQLGVSISDYPLPQLFPVGYFRDILRTSMSVAEVHATIRGYTRVLHCGDHKEVYYFYTTNDRTTRRFQVWYKDGHFNVLEGEDSNSHTIHVGDCEVGMLPEN